jgi:hypothetical protein
MSRLRAFKNELLKKIYDLEEWDKGGNKKFTL